MLKISYAGCLGLPPATLAQFTLEMRVAARNREKFTKTPYFGGSRSSMLTFIRSSLPLLVMTSRSVPICNHFHVRRAINGEITLFKGGAPLSPLIREDSLHPVARNFVAKYKRLQAIIW